MDPEAALNTGSFTPKVIGTTAVWNFHSQNQVEIGFFLMVASALVISFLPPAIRLVQARRHRIPRTVDSNTANTGRTPAQRGLA
jgi:ABC-type Fe3+ transport system permease subunit